MGGEEEDGVGRGGEVAGACLSFTLLVLLFLAGGAQLRHKLPQLNIAPLASIVHQRLLRYPRLMRSINLFFVRLTLWLLLGIGCHSSGSLLTFLL